MIWRKGLASLFLLALSGCATFPDITQARSACVMEPGGWCSFTRDAASDSFVYAIAATNVYKDEDEMFDLAGTSLRLVKSAELPEEEARTGFDYDIYERYERDPGALQGERLLERIMAFRGTDAGARDVIFGSLRDDHRELALKYFDIEIANHPGTSQWVVTGHSLGGALATEVSVRKPDMENLRVFAFNVSPFHTYNNGQLDTKRIVINERGEILRDFRRFRPAPPADMYIVSCIPRESSLEKHSITRLASCLTWIAAYRSNEAMTFIEANANGPERTRIAKPPVECGEPEKVHPGPGHVEREPCLHSAMRLEDRERERQGTSLPPAQR